VYRVLTLKTMSYRFRKILVLSLQLGIDRFLITVNLKNYCAELSKL